MCLQVRVMISLNKLCAKKMTYLKMGKIIIIKYIKITKNIIEHFMDWLKIVVFHVGF